VCVCVCVTVVDVVIKVMVLIVELLHLTQRATCRHSRGHMWQMMAAAAVVQEAETCKLIVRGGSGGAEGEQ
jgi:hypothetical protein